MAQNLTDKRKILVRLTAILNKVQLALDGPDSDLLDFNDIEFLRGMKGELKLRIERAKGSN
jgi:hypothetical protein